jgi:fructokinase
MNKSSIRLYGGIEAGGTKFVCAVGTGPEDLRAQIQFPTTTPAETVTKAIDFFQKHSASEPLAAIGIASFGPLDLNPESSTFGYIIQTPKEGWSGVNLAGIIENTLGIPVVIDTDVNGAALGERNWGAARELDNFIYLTVGTGIGGGGIINGKLMHGLIHPEVGHIRLPHDLKADPFPGSCPFHGDCWEGLASGDAMEKRWGKSPEHIPPDHPAWKLETTYIALGVSNLILTLSPQRIILGGGIMKKSGLLPAIRQKVKELLNGYIASPEVAEKLDRYLVSPELGDMSGVLGAIALSQRL